MTIKCNPWAVRAQIGSVMEPGHRSVTVYFKWVQLDVGPPNVHLRLKFYNLIGHTFFIHWITDTSEIYQSLEDEIKKITVKPRV